ncbi:MAG: hypothetical protein V2A54_16720 [Bacteroidota bacterium]
MKTLILILTSSMLMIGASCKTKKIASGIQMDAGKYHLLVSFYSPGDGIDVATQGKYDEAIKKFEKDNKLTISIEKANWGREGEIDYCINLNNFNATQQTEFIDMSKKLLSTSTKVNILENCDCKHKK